jgi:hypothetical protein
MTQSKKSYPLSQAAYKKKSVLKQKAKTTNTVKKKDKHIKFYSHLINESDIELRTISCPQCSKILTINAKSSEASCLWGHKRACRSHRLGIENNLIVGSSYTSASDKNQQSSSSSSSQHENMPQPSYSTSNFERVLDNNEFEMDVDIEITADQLCTGIVQSTSSSADTGNNFELQECELDIFMHLNNGNTHTISSIDFVKNTSNDE